MAQYLPFRQWLARRRLQALVNANRDSFEVALFRKNREAQLGRRKEMRARSLENLAPSITHVTEV